jgi:hypothetical protein
MTTRLPAPAGQPARRWAGCCLLLIATLGPVAATPAVAAGGEPVQVTDAFIELHTGPGRGFPVFFVAAKDEWIEIERRHTDWFKVRTAGGKLGWVQRQQLSTTLTEAGSQKTFRDIALDDYLQRKVEMGASWGRFRREPMLKAFASYRLADALSLEGNLGQVQGVFSGSDFWHANLAMEPWSDRRWSPFFTVGLGQFKNLPNTSLVGAQTVDAKLAHAGIGLKLHLGERFAARVDYSIYTAFVADTRAAEFRALSAGLSFFF